MKKWVCLFCFFGGFFSVTTVRAQAQEIQQLLLDVEKLAQLKNILSDMKKGYDILSGGYSTIKNISEGTFDLHKTFLDGLLDVSPVVKAYKRVADIAATQIQLVREYKKALRQLRQSGSFSPGELNYLSGVYSNLFNRSLESLAALTKVLTAGQLRMSDDERLDAVDTIWKEVEEGYTFFKQFTAHAKVLALQRIKEQQDVDGVKNLYHLH